MKFKCYIIITLVITITSCKKITTIDTKTITSQGEVLIKKLPIKYSETAIIVIDMWDKHHCKPAEKRVNQLAKKLNSFLKILRRKGVSIIFSPTNVIHAYKNTPQRIKIRKISSSLPINTNIKSLHYDPLKPPFPIQNGCENESENTDTQPWTKQNKYLELVRGDVISHNIDEIVSFLRYKKINTILFTGAHSNLCITNNPFGIRNLKALGYKTILIKDMTDSYTKNRSHEFYTQKQRNEIISKHIETYLAPTTNSSNFN